MTKLKTPSEKRAIRLDQVIVGSLIVACITGCFLIKSCEQPKPVMQVNPTTEDNFLNLK